MLLLLSLFHLSGHWEKAVRGKANPAFAVSPWESCAWQSSRRISLKGMGSLLSPVQGILVYLSEDKTVPFSNCHRTNCLHKTRSLLRRARLASCQAHRAFHLHCLINFLQSSLCCFRTWYIWYPTKSFLFLCHASTAPVFRKYLDVKFDLSHYVSFLLRIFDSLFF